MLVLLVKCHTCSCVLPSSRKPLKELDQVNFVSSWIGPRGMDLAHVRGIPSVFVIDSNMEILAYIRGYTTDDKRVDEALNAALESSSSPTPEKP